MSKVKTERRLKFFELFFGSGPTGGNIRKSASAAGMKHPRRDGENALRDFIRQSENAKTKVVVVEAEPQPNNAADTLESSRQAREESQSLIERFRDAHRAEPQPAPPLQQQPPAYTGLGVHQNAIASRNAIYTVLLHTDGSGEGVPIQNFTHRSGGPSYGYRRVNLKGEVTYD